MAEEHIDDFMQAFGKGRKFGDPAEAEERLRRERRAGQTAKQRGKKSTAKKQFNTRASDQTHRLVDALVAKLGNTKTDVLEEAIKRLAEAEGVK